MVGMVAFLFLFAQVCVGLAPNISLPLPEPRTPIDPDSNRTMCEIVMAKGYPCEEHWATTSDGYILGMFRMPQKGPPVLLQHGLLDSSFTWVMNFPSQSLSYILHDMGYDVWMGNNRLELHLPPSPLSATDKASAQGQYLLKEPHHS